jgi:UDP-glucuronate 4-epimerase
MKIFLTGSNGYIGSAFLKKASKDHKIFAVTRKKKNKKVKNVKWLVGSIVKNWEELKKSDILVHLATDGGYERFPKFNKCYDFNYLKSKKLVNNAYKAGCKKWIIATTKKEKQFKNFNFDKSIIRKYEKKPDFAYAFSKALFSNYCQRFSKKNEILCKIIRFFHVYGGQEKKMRLWPSLIEKAKNNEDFFMSPGQQKTDFNFIDDVIDGIIKTLNFKKKIKKYPQVWELGSGRTLTVKQFAKIIWKKLNSNGKLIFSKKIVSDKSNYRTDKKKLWKINYTHPSKTVNKL